MTTVWIVALLVLGLLLTVKGGDLFVDAAGWMAEVSGMPRFLIGATVVSLATTLPELLVSLLAALEGKTGLAVGNAAGSVTANTGLILGLAALFAPQPVAGRDFGAKGLLMALAAGLLFALTRQGVLRPAQGCLLLGVLGLFLWESIASARRRSEAGTASRPAAGREAVLLNLCKFVAGAAGIALGARLLVDNGSALARQAGASEGLIGATILAVGTSLPELVTMVTALRKSQAALSIGNILGANVIDLALILPLCALVSGQPLTLGAQATGLDVPFCLLAALLAVVPTLLTRRLRRGQGAALLGLYAAYVALLLLGFTGSQ